MTLPGKLPCQALSSLMVSKGDWWAGLDRRYISFIHGFAFALERNCALLDGVANIILNLISSSGFHFLGIGMWI